MAYKRFRTRKHKSKEKRSINHRVNGGSARSLRFSKPHDETWSDNVFVDNLGKRLLQLDYSKKDASELANMFSNIYHKDPGKFGLTPDVYIQLCSFLDEAMSPSRVQVNPPYAAREIVRIFQKDYPEVAFVLTIINTVQQLENIISDNERAMNELKKFVHTHVKDPILRNITKPSLLNYLVAENKRNNMEIQNAIYFIDVKQPEDLEELGSIIKNENKLKKYERQLSDHGLVLERKFDLSYRYERIKDFPEFEQLLKLHRNLIVEKDPDLYDRIFHGIYKEYSTKQFGPNTRNNRGNLV